MSDKSPFALAMLTVVSLLLTSPARAEAPTGQSLVPLPSILDFTQGQGFGVALGAGVEYESA
jgi:hypothetical protein